MRVVVTEIEGCGNYNCLVGACSCRCCSYFPKIGGCAVGK